MGVDSQPRAHAGASVLQRAVRGRVEWRAGRPQQPARPSAVFTVPTDMEVTPKETTPTISVFAPSYPLKTADGKALVVKVAQFNADEFQWKTTTLEVQKEGGPWVRVLFDAETLSPFVRGPFAAALQCEKPSDLPLSNFGCWLLVKKVTMMLTTAAAQRNWLPLTMFLIVFFTVVGTTIGAIGPAFAGFAPFIKVDAVLKWFDSMIAPFITDNADTPLGTFVDVAIRFVPAGYTWLVGMRQQIADGASPSRIMDGFRNLLLPLGATLAWVFFSVMRMDWMWPHWMLYAGSTSLFLAGAIHKNQAHTALRDFINQTNVEARTQRAYRDQSRVFLDMVIRLSHDALHIRFRNGEIYPHTGAMRAFTDLPRFVTNFRNRDQVMWIDPTSEHPTLVTPTHLSSARKEGTAPSTADINQFCADLTKEIIVSRLDTRLGDVITSLMRLHLLLRTVVFHGYDDAIGGETSHDGSPERLCFAKWRADMQKAWDMASGRDANRFDRAAFIFVWRDFLVCKDRDAGDRAARTLASLVKKGGDSICANVYNMSVVSGEAFRRVDDRKWFVLKNRYAGRRSDGSTRTCDKPTLCDMCVDVRPSHHAAARSSDAACVDAILIFLSLLWAENRRLLLRTLTDHDLEQAKTQIGIAIDVKACDAVCAAQSNAKSSMSTPDDDFPFD